MQHNLIENKIYQGGYTFNRKEYFCFFKIINENDVIDIITNKVFDLSKFTTIYHEVDINYIKHIKCLYKNNKDLNVFLKKDYLTIHLNTFYSKILRFFNLESYRDLTSIDISKEKLDSVRCKLKKYVRRYMDQSSVDLYVKNIKRFHSIQEILSILPSELKEKIDPFWVDILQKDSFYIWDIGTILEKYDLLDYFELNVSEPFINGEIIKNKYKELLNCYISTCELACDAVLASLKEKNKEAFEIKLQEAFTTLDVESKQAQEYNDNDLLVEINVIIDELNTIKEKTLNIIDNLKINSNIEEWFPELLYPIPDIEISNLTYLYREFKDIIDAVSNNETYPYYDKTVINFIENNERFNKISFKHICNIFELKKFFND